MQDSHTYREDRHTNKLPTQEDRQLFTERIVEALEIAAVAMSQVATELKTKSEGLLAWAFTPSKIGMIRSEVAEFEITCTKDTGGIVVSVQGKTMLDPETRREVGFQVLRKANGDLVTQFDSHWP